VQSTNIHVCLTPTEHIALGWLPRTEWDHYWFDASEVHTGQPKSILKKRKIHLGTYKCTMTKPLQPNSHNLYIDEIEGHFEWIR
jgi:hypothetical protein